MLGIYPYRLAWCFLDEQKCKDLTFRVLKLTRDIKIGHWKERDWRQNWKRSVSVHVGTMYVKQSWLFQLFFLQLQGKQLTQVLLIVSTPAT